MESAMPDPATLATPELIERILSDYHAVHRRDLPELIALAGKVERVHGDRPEAPRGLAKLLREIAIDLETHMKKEEFVLFPAMSRGMVDGLNSPIAVMRLDHDDHGAALEQLRALTGGFAVPPGACGSWQRLYAGLEKFSGDLRAHIEIENGSLFPRFELAAPLRCTCAHG
jgi:regulator of cell morphogenesis and NO signaling